MLGDAVGNARLAVAMSLDMATIHATRALGPLVGGVLLHWHGIAGIYAIAVVLNGASLLNALGLRRRATSGAPPPVAAGFVRTLSDGLAFARANPLVLAVLTVTVIVNLFGFSYVSIAPVIGEQVLGLDPVGVGIMMATEGFGALVGSLGLATFVRPAWYRPLFSAGGGPASSRWWGCSRSPTWFRDVAFDPVLLGPHVAGFAAMQSTLLMHGTPPAMRSR